MSESLPGYDAWKLQAPEFKNQIMQTTISVAITLQYDPSNYDVAYFKSSICTALLENCDALENTQDLDLDFSYTDPEPVEE